MLPLAPLAASAQEALSDAPWKDWLKDWRWIEALTNKRGWEVTPLEIAPPASEADIRQIEAAFSIRFPTQLRMVMTRHSARVTLGWHIPFHLRPIKEFGFPGSGGVRDAAWDINQIRESAIPNFLNWKKYRGDGSDVNVLVQPQMWENQFALYELCNGDMVTIDVSNPNGRQPVRYFGHDADGSQGDEIAPDFFTFINEFSSLGLAGCDDSDWLAFMDDKADHLTHIRADSKGGKEWLAWLELDPADVGPDEPPPVILAATDADHALLGAARAEDIAGVKAALKAGANINATTGDIELAGVLSGEYGTAVNFAARSSNIAMLEVLVQAGASLNLRRLSITDAADCGSPETMRWLIEHGARVNGWKGERYWPLHILMTLRVRSVGESRQELSKRLVKEQGEPNMVTQMHHDYVLARFLMRSDYLGMIDALLDAGADPDARWDNRTTMLMWTPDDGVIQSLLEHGADVRLRDFHGRTALHWARTPEIARLLVKHDADVNDATGPAHKESDDIISTPLQAHLGWRANIPVVRTLIELGADPKRKDNFGYNTLSYCSTAADLKFMQSFGLDISEHLPKGRTLLHNLVRVKAEVRAGNPEEVEILDYLLAQGIGINAVDELGQTMLHLAAQTYEQPENIELLLRKGADKSARDLQGKRPLDLVPARHEGIHTLLK